MTSSELRTFTSESVTEGHPDKICDQISDAILDDLLSQDRDARVAVETLVTTGLVHVAGEVRTTGYSDVATIVRDVIREIGYDSSEKGFDADSCGVQVSIGAQSPDIAQGVDNSLESRGDLAAEAFARLGAGDQGLMFGYACRDTPELMPLPIHAAHRLTRNLSAARRDGVLPYLRPDGKTQVSIGYDEDGVARSVDAIVVSTQHSEADRAQDHRRHLRRHGPPRRRRLLRQGPVRARPLRPRAAGVHLGAHGPRRGAGARAVSAPDASRIPRSSLDPELAARLKRDADGLITAVVQDATDHRVLMVGWMDDEALHRTLTTGRATYWSRSRGEYWRKGDTSGHVQWVRSVALDCDADTLLVRVDQVGAACHRGTDTCFDDGDLRAVVLDPTERTA